MLASMLPMLMGAGGRARMHFKSNSIYYIGLVAGYLGMLNGHPIPIINKEASGFLMMFGCAPFNVGGTFGKIKSFAQGYTFGQVLRSTLSGTSS